MQTIQIEIDVIGGIEPELIGSYIIDTKGNGIGDSIAVKLKLGEADGFYTVGSLDSVKYDWDKGSLITANLLVLSDATDSEFGILDGSFTTGAGEGEIHLSFSNV